MHRRILGIFIVALLNQAIEHAAAEPRDTRALILARIANVLPKSFPARLAPLLEDHRIDHTLWRWALGQGAPILRDLATPLLGSTEYSPARFARLMVEMESAVIQSSPRAYDFMVAVAEMRAASTAAAAQLREHVDCGVPTPLREHYYRSRFEYELVPPGGEATAMAREITGPSRAAQSVALREAVRFVRTASKPARAELIAAIDHYLMMADEAQLTWALDLLRGQTLGLDELIPRLVSLRVHHPRARIRRRVAAELYRLRGGDVGALNRLKPSAQDLTALAAAFRDIGHRGCELLFYDR